MKKLIVIGVLLVAVLGAGIFETVFMTTYFDGLSTELEEIAVMAGETEEEQVNEAALLRLDALIGKWDENTPVFYALNNNNVLNNLFERIAQGRAYAAGGQNVDARAGLESAAFYAKSIAKDILPIPINFI